jgi:glycosyltransferase involved in cell wall biosynthesis
MISVVIPSYRKPELLDRTLASLSVQREASDWEVVVVDDGSLDRTPDVAREWGRRLPLRLVQPPRNEGRAKARNRGWRAARGDHVLFLDDDIQLEPWGLAAHQTAQRTRPAVYLGEVRTSPELIDSELFDYLDSRGIAKHSPGERVPARYLLTQNVSLPRAALEQVGGFDEDFGAYGFEDMELAFRLEDSAGAEFFFLDGARGWHSHHHTLAEYLEKKRNCGESTLPRLLELHPRRAREMQLDLLLPQPGTPAPQRLLGASLRLSFRAGLPRLIEALLSPRAFPLPPGPRRRAFDYLVLCAYWQGLREPRSATTAVS